MQDFFSELIKLLLPEIIVDYFELTSYKKAEEILHLHFKEINSIPKEYRQNKLSSKGFFEEITVQDFPIRAHQVYLHITRRRWLNEDTGQVVFRNWNLVADGTRLTQEFAFFLKRSIDSKPNDCNAIASFYGVSGKNLQHQYKDFLSDFKTWDQLSHAKQWLIFPKNLGKRLSIDETSLSNGDLYTILTTKAAKGKKGTIVAMITGTKADTVIAIIEKIPLKARNQVTEITLDMAANMGLIAKKCFPNATRVTDRFHVQKLALEALQEIRIKYPLASN
jgi:transposase